MDAKQSVQLKTSNDGFYVNIVHVRIVFSCTFLCFNIIMRVFFTNSGHKKAAQDARKWQSDAVFCLVGHLGLEPSTNRL